MYNKDFTKINMELRLQHYLWNAFYVSSDHISLGEQNLST